MKFAGFAQGERPSISLAGGRIFPKSLAFVMGIVNATPDSFYGESRGGLALAMRLAEEGADIIDIGGESTRSGSQYVEESEELCRVLPLVRQIRRESDIPISVDTRKASVLRAALDEGADILNDVSALEDDPEMPALCVERKIPVILMHKKAIPAIMEEDAGGVFEQVSGYLEARANFAVSRGIAEEKIIVDPGIGFGKNLGANLGLVRGCGRLCGGRFPVLMALSRKRFLGELTGRPAEGRLAATLAANLAAVASGASIIRVHDVAAAADSLRVFGACAPSH